MSDWPNRIPFDLHKELEARRVDDWHVALRVWAKTHGLKLKLQWFGQLERKMADLHSRKYTANPQDHWAAIKEWLERKSVPVPNGNFIGTDATGTRVSSGGGAASAGIAFNLGPDRNVVGGPNRADRNVISGNERYGIRINHGETSENVIENNIIGMDPGLQNRLAQGLGIDLQWWTWGNYVTGNLISGQGGQGVDLSHSAVGNVIINNRFGTGSGGNGGNSSTENGMGITFKDNPVDNWVVNNVIGNSRSHGLWHRHNFTGGNHIIGNRIGVGSRGANIGNGGWGIHLTGHDDLYQDNIVANNEDGAVYISNVNGGNANYPPEKTLGNEFRQNTYYNTPSPFIDIESQGQNSNDSGDRDDGAHLKLNYPTVSGLGPGQLYGSACARCTVEVYVSGSVQSDGTLNPGSSNRGQGAGWIGRAVANGQGRFSLAEPAIRSGKNLTLVAIDRSGNTSEFSPIQRVGSSFQGTGSGAAANRGRQSAPSVPGRPDAYAGRNFNCSHAGSTLSWDNAGAGEYYVFSTVGGAENYVGPIRATSSTVPPADSYRVEHWVDGFATNATCGGPGVAAFACSFQGGVLSWGDVGAGEYYAFATVGGVERYLGAVRGTSVSTGPADSFRVEHWLSGRRTNATCGGPGVAAFACSFQGGVLSWGDVGAGEYYAFATVGGVERYLGAVRGTSVSTGPADSFRVEHWLTGRVTNAVCR